MKHSKSEKNFSNNPFKELIKDDKNQENIEKNLYIKNAQLTKEILRLKEIINKMTKEREFYLCKIQESDRTFLSGNELKMIEREKSENVEKINELKKELENKNNENDKLAQEIEKIKTESNKMTKIYEAMLSKMDKFIKACNI